MAGILPLLIALITAHAAELQPPLLNQLVWTWLLLSLLLFCGAHLAVSAALQYRGHPSWLRLWDGAGLGILLMLNAWWCLKLGWTQVSDWSLIILLPTIIGLAWHWYSLGLAAGHGLGARSLWALWLRLRLVLLPVILLVGIMDLFQWVLTLGDLPKLWESSTGGWLLLGLTLLAPLMALAFLPPFLVRLWGARVIEPGPEQERLTAWCADSGVAIRAVMVWPAHGIPFYNAAVLGLLPRFRYILISEDLLRDCPPEQVKAVLGHELGHAKHGHLWFYLLFLLASGMWAQLATQFLVAWLQPLLPMLAGAFGYALITVLIWGIILRLGFGILSRASERQADVYGAQLAGDPSHMAAALYSVAHLSGADPHEPNWRHYSIADRVAYLGRLRDSAHTQSYHGRYMMNLRALILVLLGIGLAMTLLAPPRYADLQTLRENDSILDTVLTQAADEGDRQPLQRWLLQQTPQMRANLGMAIYRRLANKNIASDDRLLYAHRDWLIPFAEVSTGNEELDIVLDNTLAYGLAAGTLEHSEEELALIQQLLPPLRAAAEDLEDAALWDTVGCMHFALGDRKAAVNAFQRAQQLLADPKEDDELSIAMRRIVTERSRAAMDPNASLPVIWGTEGQLTISGKPVIPEEIEPEAAGDEPAGSEEAAAPPVLDPSLRQ